MKTKQRKFSHQTLFIVIAVGYTAFALLGLIGVLIHLANGATADFGIYK
jgi:hypothetical protein